MSRKQLVAQEPVPSEPLHIKYRPQDWDDVLGNDACIKNLKTLFAAQRVPHTFLFTGPYGCGKTTLARIVAAKIGCSVIEVDAARYSTVDAMRELLASAQYRALGDSGGKKMFIIDEAHGLSKQAQDVLLITAEQPPAHLYLSMCTTASEKINKTLRSRAHTYDLKPCKWDLIAEYMEEIAQVEKLRIGDGLIEFAARRSDGSLRQSLVYLSMLDGISDKSEAAALLDTADTAQGAPYELARLLCYGNPTWEQARKMVNEDLADVHPETIRITIQNVAAAALGKANEKQAARLLAVVDQFSRPFEPSARMAPVYLALGNLLVG